MLPKPKRFMVNNLTNFAGVFPQLVLYITTDMEVAEFINTLAPVLEIKPATVGSFRIELDPLYCTTEKDMDATVAWLRDQLEQEFCNTSKPAKKQMEE